MRKKYLTTALILLLGIGLTVAKDIPQSLVPSVIVNKFQQSYPNARDIEWEMKGEVYEVEFELGWPKVEHEILYDLKGNVLLHKQDIAQSDLPAQVSRKIHTEYPDYKVKKISKIESRGKTIYKMTVKTYKQKWKLELDSKGNIINKK